MNKKDLRVEFGKEDRLIEIAYLFGSIDINIPCIRYKWINIDNIYAGECIWYQDILPETRLVFENNSIFNVSIEFGSHILKGVTSAYFQ